MWNSFGDVLKQANAMKENLEKQLDEAVGASSNDEVAFQNQAGDEADKVSRVAETECVDRGFNVSSNVHQLNTNLMPDEDFTDTGGWANDEDIIDLDDENEVDETVFFNQPESVDTASPVSEIIENDIIKPYEPLIIHDDIPVENVAKKDEGTSQEDELVVEEMNIQQPCSKIAESVHEEIPIVNQLEEFEEESSTESPLLQELRLLKGTLAQREKQLENAAQNSMALQAEIQNLSSKPSSNAGLENKLRVNEAKLKEEQLKSQALFQEGVELSKKQAMMEHSMKALRVDLRKVTAERDDTSATIHSLHKELETVKTERMVEFKNWYETEQQLKARISSTPEIEVLQADVQKSKVQQSNLQSSLDSCSEELRAQKQETLSVNQMLKASQLDQDKLRHQLSEHLGTSKMRNDKASVMENTVSELRMTLQQQNKENSLTEEGLRRELKVLKRQLLAVEKRNEDMTASTATATAPLLRQMEALESMNRTQRDAYEQTQTSIMARVISAEKAEGEAAISKRRAETERSEMQLKLAEAEAGIQMEKQEKERVIGRMTMVESRLEALQQKRKSLETEVLDLNSRHANKMLEMKKIQAELRQAVSALETKHEQEVLGLSAIHAEVVERLEGKIRRLNVPHHSSASSVISEATQFKTQSEILENIGLSVGRSSHTPIDAEPIVPSSSSPIYTQQLEGQLKRKEGEIESLKNQLATISRTRNALADELGRVGDRLRILEVQSATFDQLQVRFQEMSLRHDLLLEMVGEKEELIEELTSDMETMKIAFRQQLDTYA